ncbi:MAG: c-type cytochrome domain-containing protein, partial [Pirellulales bacterium]
MLNFVTIAKGCSISTATSLVLAIGVTSTTAEIEQNEDPISVAKVDHPLPVDFETEVLPMLRQNCLACHNQTDAESDLVLETPQSIKTGGVSGSAVIPGKSEESMLLLAAAHRDEPFMPPADNDVGAKNLTSDQLGLIKLWIDQGARGEVSAATPVQWQPPSRDVR